MKTIHITPSTQIIMMVAAMAAALLGLASQAPEIQRYLKVRGM